MLAIRLQRTGRKGHAMFRMVVQDSRVTPTSGKVVAWLGSYNPHSKSLNIDKEKTEKFVSNGAQPSERVAMLLKKDGMKLPKWVVESTKKDAKTKNTEKLRKNQPATPASEAETEIVETSAEATTPAEEPTAAEQSTEEAK